MTIHDDGPRLKWHLAVVQELQRGNDNLVRSAIIRTANGVTNRPISKLYPLEVNVGTNVLRGEPQVAGNDDDDDVSDASPQQDVKTSIPSCPPRLAAVKARTRVAEWNKVLRGPEDVMN